MDEDEIPHNGTRCGGSATPYMAHHGWVGLRLDTGDTDMDEVEELLRGAYVLVAPKTLARRLAGGSG